MSPEEHLESIRARNRVCCLHCGLDFKNQRLLDYHHDHTACGEFEAIDKEMDQERRLGQLSDAGTKHTRMQGEI